MLIGISKVVVNMMMLTITMMMTMMMKKRILVHLILTPISQHFLGFHFVTAFETTGESEFRHVVVVVVNVVVVNVVVVVAVVFVVVVIVEPLFGEDRLFVSLHRSLCLSPSVG